AHVANARADQLAEDEEVQDHGDRRRHQGLAPDAQDAHYLAAGERAQRDPVQLRARGCLDVGFGADLAHAASSRARALPVRRTNSSSRRLDLVRIERTRMPAASNVANTRLRSIARGMSRSSVWS